MAKFVSPSTYLIGIPTVDIVGLSNYLKDTGQEDFIESFNQFVGGAPSYDGLALCSFYAKLCYKSLVLGKNANVSRIRDIEANVKGCFDTGHGSVFEHCWLNFVTTNCSRVFTHELVRHRVGTAFSQTSGRYVAIDSLDLVIPPELLPEADLVMDTLETLEAALVMLRERLIKSDMPFDQKKKVTSAIRRLAPNGQSNEIGWSCNIRSLRHMIELRTSRHAEWEIRKIFSDVATIINNRWPEMLHNGSFTTVDGLPEWVGLRV